MLAALPIIFLSILIRPALSFLRSPVPSSLTLSKGELQLVRRNWQTSYYRKLSNSYQLARTNHAAIVTNNTLILIGGVPSTPLPANNNALFNTLIAWNQPSENTRGGQWWMPKKLGTPSVLSLPPQPYATKALLTAYGVMVYAPTPTHTTGTNQPSSLALLDLKNWTWSFPDTRGHRPTKCAGPTLVSRNDITYMLGGMPLTGDNKPDTTRPLLDEFTSLNMKTKTWTTLPPAKSLVQHTMCYNPVLDALITFGGKTEVETGQGKEWPVVDWLMIFDLKTNTWNMNLTNFVSGGGPGRRKRHTATCLPNGQMIVYGGSRTTNTVKVTDAQDTTYDTDTDVWVLNVTRIKQSENTGSGENAWNWGFVWWKPEISNIVDGPGARMGHSSSLFGNSLVLYGGTGAAKADISSIHTLDTRSWRWSKLAQPITSNQVVAATAPSKAPTASQESGMLKASETGSPGLQNPEDGAVPTDGMGNSQLSTTSSAPPPWMYVASFGGGLMFSFAAGMCFWTRFLQRKKMFQSEDDEANPDRQGPNVSENAAFMTVRDFGENGDHGFGSPSNRNVDGTVVNNGTTNQETELGMTLEGRMRPASVHSQMNIDRIETHFEVAIGDIALPAERPDPKRIEKWSSRVLTKLRSSLSLNSSDMAQSYSTHERPNVKQLVRTFDSLANKSKKPDQQLVMKVENPAVDERNTSNFSDMEVHIDRYQSSMPALGGLMAILRNEAPVPYQLEERDISCRRRSSLASLSSFEYLAKCGYFSPTSQTSPSPFADASVNANDPEDGIDIESFSTIGRLSKLPAAFYIAKLMADIERDADKRAKLDAKQEPIVNSLSLHDGSLKTPLAKNENMPFDDGEEIWGKCESSGERAEDSEYRLVRSERSSSDETINSSGSYHTSREAWSTDGNVSQEHILETFATDGGPTRTADTNQVASPMVPLNERALSPPSNPLKRSDALAQIGSPPRVYSTETPKIIVSSKVDESNLPRLESTRTISTLATLVGGVDGNALQPEKSTLCTEQEVTNGKDTSSGLMVHWKESLIKTQFESASADITKPKSVYAEETRLTMVSSSEAPHRVSTAVRPWSFLRALRQSRDFSSILRGIQSAKHTHDYSSPSPPANPIVIFPITTVSAAALMSTRNQTTEKDPRQDAFGSRPLSADILSESHSPLDRLAKMKWASRHRHRRTEAGSDERLSFRPSQMAHLSPGDAKFRFSTDVSTAGIGSRAESQDMSHCEWSIGEGEVSSIFGKTNLLRKECGAVMPV